MHNGFPLEFPLEENLRDPDFLQGPASAEPGDQAHPDAAEQKGAWNGNDARAGRAECQVVETDIHVSAVPVGRSVG